MAKRRFKTRYVVDIELDIEEELIREAQQPDWRALCYRLTSDQDVVDHIAYNLVCNRAQLPQLDGFAHRKKEDAVVVNENWDVENWDVDVDVD